MDIKIEDLERNYGYGNVYIYVNGGSTALLGKREDYTKTGYELVEILNGIRKRKAQMGRLEANVIALLRGEELPHLARQREEPDEVATEEGEIE